MKLIKDYVTNHWGAEHWMFKDMPTYDWFHQFPGYKQSNYRMTTQYDTNGSKRDAKYCMDGWFVPSMPDLNQSNPLVLNYLVQNAIWWIEYADLDGFRVDTYSYNDKQGIAKWTKAITDEYPYFNIVAEVWMHDQAQISYWQKDSPISKIQSYNSYCPSVMDFTLHDVFGNVFYEDRADWSNGMIKFYENFVNDFLYPNPNNLLIFLENHDTGRFNQIYQNDLKKYQLGMTIMATMRGIPQLYYGSEIGMAGDKGKGDAAIRQDFPGGWKGDANNAFLASGRTTDQAKFFDFSKKVLNWRKNKEVIHTGKLTHYIPENNVYVYFRHNDNETVMVVINNATDLQKINLERFQENIKSFASGNDIISGRTIDLKNELSVEGKTSMILELK
jgi:glycosidase